MLEKENRNRTDTGHEWKVYNLKAFPECLPEGKERGVGKEL